MELDGIGPNRSRGFDLRKLGVDEERDLDAGAPQRGDEGRERRDLARDIETAFGREFLPPLWHEAAGMGTRGKRYCQHLWRYRYFEIERRKRGRGQPRNVVVADVAAILAQMRGDGVGARLHRELRAAQRIGMAPSPRVAQRRDVIDVDAKADRRGARALARGVRRRRGHWAPNASRPDRSSSSRRRRCL